MRQFTDELNITKKLLPSVRKFNNKASGLKKVSIKLTINALKEI